MNYTAVCVLTFLAACGSDGSPPASPVAQPTLAPPGAASVPARGFPLLDVALEGQIVYSNGDGDIYLVEPRPNARPRKVLAAPAKASLGEPAWSPDGQRIIYAYLLPFDITGLPTQDILIAGADGSRPQTVLEHQASGEVYASPVFSPDGRYIYYSHTTPFFQNKQVVSATLTLERFEVQSREVKAIAEDGMQPAVSPDGRRLAFIRSDPDTFVQNLWIAGSEGEGAVVIVPGGGMGGALHAPRWTPDGRRILFAAPNFFSRLSQPRTTEGRRPMTDLFSVLRPPSSVGDRWLIDFLGTRVAEAHGAPWDFWMVDDTGKNLQRITEIGEDMPYAAFAPDGRQFAFIGVAGLYIADADGTLASGNRLRWLHREGGHGRLDWKK